MDANVTKIQLSVQDSLVVTQEIAWLDGYVEGARATADLMKQRLVQKFAAKQATAQPAPEPTEPPATS